VGGSPACFKLALVAVPADPPWPITPYQTKSKHRKSKMNTTANGKIVNEASPGNHGEQEIPKVGGL
jgi:hypothetical protein